MAEKVQKALEITGWLWQLQCRNLSALSN